MTTIPSPTYLKSIDVLRQALVNALAARPMAKRPVTTWYQGIAIDLIQALEDEGLVIRDKDV